MNVISLAEAKSKNLLFYFTSRPCSRGHVAYRYVSNASCVDCYKTRPKRSYNKAIDNPRAKRYYHNLRSRLLRKLGGMCVACGEDDFRVLQVDHIKGNGNKEFDSLTVAGVYRKALKYSKPYQLLCANCNWIKKFNKRESVALLKDPSNKTLRSRKYWQQLRGDVFSLYSNKCAHCGNSDFRCFQLDHIRGQGSKEFKARGNYSVYKKALKMPKDFQLLCANCNWIKKHENMEVVNAYGQGTRI